MSDEKNEVIATTEKSGHMLATMTGVALAVMAGAVGYGYVQMTQMNSTLARTTAEFRQQSAANQRTVESLQQSLTVLQKSALMAAERGDAAKWNVAEAKYLTKQALTQLQVGRDIPAALLLLQHASEIIQDMNNPSVEPIRQALSDNLNQLQSQTPLSVEQVYTQLNVIFNELDNLSLPTTPLQYTEEANGRQKDYSEAPWWKSQWHKTMDSLRKVVIVRYMGANEMPLIMPEEKMFLYQNLHAQMQAAMLGVLTHNHTVYQTSLADMAAWIQKYFVQDSPLTVKVLSQIHELQMLNLQTPNVDLAATLQLFDQYLANSMRAQPQQASAATPQSEYAPEPSAAVTP